VIGGLSLLPAFAVRHPVCIRPSCTSWSRRLSRTAPGRGLDHAPPWWVTSPPPQGPSLGSGLFCPGPSSLNRPHPPHPRAHHDFTAWRLIRDAFAVRERRSDPRVVPGFRCSFLPGMPSSPTPGRPTSKCSRASMPTWPSPFDHRLGTPKNSRNPFHAGFSFRGFTGSLPLRPARLLAPLHGSDWDAPALGDFYFQAFDGSVSLPAAGYNYNSDWTPLLAGFSPAGMTASLAARSKRESASLGLMSAIASSGHTAHSP
jgi:hypothetical protein